MNEAAYWLYNNIFKLGQTQTMVPVKFEKNVHQAYALSQLLSSTVLYLRLFVCVCVCARVCVDHEISEEMKLQEAISYYKEILFMHKQQFWLVWNDKSIM